MSGLPRSADIVSVIADVRKVSKSEVADRRLIPFRRLPLRAESEMAFAHTGLDRAEGTVAPPSARVGVTAEFALCVAFRSHFALELRLKHRS
jgi:hypothetical protein